MKYLLFVFLFSIFANVSAVSAQVVDMRAYSRQRGLKSYYAKKPTAAKTNAAQQNVSQIRKKEMTKPQSADASQATSGDNAEKENEPIRQTGIKIFQEKDENKVLNFDVENPEFKKLNKKQQQDLLNRITFE